MECSLRCSASSLLRQLDPISSAMLKRLSFSVPLCCPSSLSVASRDDELGLSLGVVDDGRPAGWLS